MEAGLQDIGLDGDLALGGDEASGRHVRSEVAALFDGDPARADVDEPAPQQDDGHDEDDEADDEVGQELKLWVVHGLSFCAGSSSVSPAANAGAARRRVSV